MIFKGTQSCRLLWRTQEWPTAVLPPGFILLLIAGGCLFCSRLADEGTDSRHLRHVTGRVARGKAEERGRRAATRGSALALRRSAAEAIE